MPVGPLSRQVVDIVQHWDGVTIDSHRGDGLAVRVDRRPIGHVRDATGADLPFPVRVRRSLVAAGRAAPHAGLPKTGWVSHPLRSEHDVPAVVALFRLNYERVRGLPPSSAVTSGIGSAPGAIRSTDVATPLVTGRAQLLGGREADDLPA